MKTHVELLRSVSGFAFAQNVFNGLDFVRHNLFELRICALRLQYNIKLEKGGG